MKKYIVGEELFDFSLLSTKKPESVIRLGETTISDLGLLSLFEEVIHNEKDREYIMNTIANLSCTKEDIIYRQNIFEDLYENDTMAHNLMESLDALNTLAEFQKFRMIGADTGSDLWALFNYLRELNVYIDAVENLKGALNCRVQSSGLLHLQEILDGIYESSGFQELKADINDMTDDISKIHSLSLGVNLDENLNPTEVILTSVNEEKVPSDIGIMNGFVEFVRKSAALNVGDFRIVHGMKKGALTERDSIMLDLTQNIERALKDIIRKLQKTLHQYVNTRGYQILNIVPELRMYLYFVQMFHVISEKGFPTSKPQVVDTDSLILSDTYNVRLAYTMFEHKEEMVYNSLSFDNQQNIFIFTGPNRGGKTILTQAVGQSVLFMILGTYVPCSQMICGAIEGIFTHFPADENDTLSYGRLGEESIRIHSIVEQVNNNCLVLLNETYATTSFSDGHYMARDFIRFLKYKNIKCLYNTHMHELASEVEELNQFEGDGRVASLVMGIADGRRSYKAEVREPDNNSFASDIAVKYGVTFAQMIEEKTK